MFDRLDDILIHYEEIMQELGEPNVTENQDRFRKLMKEQADLAPLVEAYKAYKQAKQDIEDSLALLEEESDEEMRELAKEELSDAKKRVEELEQAVCCCRKTRTMTRISSWRSAQVQAAMRQPCSRQSFTACT